MTTTSQAPLSLPPTFSTSFWPSYPSFASYRAAVSHLYSILQHGIDEDTALLALVDEIVNSHWNYVDALKEGTAAQGRIANKVKGNKPIFKGARANAPSSSLVAALHTATIDPLAASHVRTANALTRTILEPFGQWSQRHVEQVTQSWKTVEEWLDALEEGQDEIDRIKSTYEAKCRQADEAEDDARFSGLDVAAFDEEHAAAQAREESSSSAVLDAPFTEKMSLPPLPSESADETAAPSSDDPVKLERRQTLRKQFGFSPRIPSGGARSDAVASPEEATRPSISPSSSRAAGLSALAPAFQGIKERIASAAGAGGIGERYKRLRREADRHEAEYLSKSRKLDTLRCRLEDALSEQLILVQKYEVERLNAVKTMLSAYSAAMGSLHPSLAARTQTLVSAHGDPAALVGRLVASARTGFYRPLVEVFVPFYHDEPSMYASGWAGFGTNLNARWRHELLSKSSAEGSVDASSGSASSPAPAALPVVFSHLIASLERSYTETDRWPTTSPADAALEKRKTWIYDVPLSKSHACRQAIIDHVLDSAHPGAELGAGLPAVLDRFDPPTRASTLKLWLAELQECLVGEENWHLVTSLYKAADSVEGKWRQEREVKREGKKSADGAASADASPAAAGGPPKTDASTPSPVELDDDIRATITRGVMDDVSVVLSKLSTIHLVVLDSLISHLRSLMASTTDANDVESQQIYTNKLALSLGRYLLRPAKVTTSTLASKAPTLLLMDLIQHYEPLVPAALTRKNKKEEEAAVLKRRTPLRKRTKPVDQRIRRSQMGSADHPPMPIVTAGPASTAAAGTTRQFERLQLKDDVPPVPSKLDTTSATRKSDEATLNDEPEAVTPIADRVLASSASTTAATTSTLAPPASAVDEDAASATASSNPGSDYGTPKEEVTRTLSPGTVSEQPAPLASAAAAAKSSTSNSSRPSSPVKAVGTGAAAASDDGMPLSNVARLSRQFNTSNGSAGSNSGLSRSGSNTSQTTGGTGVRGPRPVSSIGGPRALPGGAKK